MSHESLKAKWGQTPEPVKSGCCGGDDATLDELYERAMQISSDINEHVPKLRELAEQCDHVTEFGHRHGESSVAILSGRPRSFVTYDTADDPLLIRLND